MQEKGLSIKDVRTQEEGVCPVRTFFGQEKRGSSDADVCSLHSLAQKTSDFSKFTVCPHGQGGEG